VRITTIRHGETDWNLQGRAQGSRDIELNATGISQAERLAVRLANEPCDVIFTSDLKRAAKTADIINSCHNVPVIMSPLLRESSFGEFEGKSIHDPVVGAAFIKFLDERAPAYFSQVQGYLKEIVSCGKDNIFIVGHFGTIRAIICGLLALPTSDRNRFSIGNTAIHVMQRRGDGTFGFILENDTGHLNS